MMNSYSSLCIYMAPKLLLSINQSILFDQSNPFIINLKIIAKYMQNSIEQQISSIVTDEPFNQNDSIINQLNLLSQSDQSRVVRIDSFIYTQESKNQQTPYKYLHQSYLHDHQGNIIPPIAYQPFYGNNPLKKQKNIKDKMKIKSIREQIMQENQILQQRFNNNNKYCTNAFPSPRLNSLGKDKNYFTSIQGGMKYSEESLGKMDQIFARLQQQYNESKIIRLYNFIIKQLPKCNICHKYQSYIIKTINGISLKCKDCHNQTIHHPLIGILYDLQNKSRFQEEISAYQIIIDKVTQKIDKLKQQINSLQILKEKFILLKNINRKRYKQINESKFYLKKHVQNFQKHHLKQLQNLIPKEYLEQMQLWCEIKQNYKSFIDTQMGIIYKIMPIHLHEEMNNKFMNNLHKILNYQKENAVKISISQHIKFPIKTIDSAVFVVDGSYSLPVFQNIHHLHLEFQNKKTLRELNLLFTNLPTEIHSLSFNYNHKIHSHISAQTFPFLKHISNIDSIKKIDISIQNMKDFDDVLMMPSIITPKKQIKIILTKHIFSKSSLILPMNYYMNLINKLGSQITKVELNLPESVDSSAVIHYQQLIALRFLCVFKINRGEKSSKEKKKVRILEDLQNNSERQRKMQGIYKKLLAKKVNFIRIIKTSPYSHDKNILASILSFLS